MTDQDKLAKAREIVKRIKRDNTVTWREAENSIVILNDALTAAESRIRMLEKDQCDWHLNGCHAAITDIEAKLAEKERLIEDAILECKGMIQGDSDVLAVLAVLEKTRALTGQGE